MSAPEAPAGSGGGRPLDGHPVGATVWLTGFSGAGKSTIGDALVRRLHVEGFDHFRLDADDLRDGLCADLGFSADDRAENVRRVGEVALLFAQRGHLSVVTIISPYSAGRAAVRARHELAGTPFVEVHVATPLEVCEARDPKGLYRRAREGELPAFTGVSAPYEPPTAPDVVLDGSACAPEQCAAALYDHLAARGLLRAIDSPAGYR
ncbi:MAG TPA: adenylyl-sulfate kinase [Acidimicrobiales bacterium]|nr:adenylyl-sulfate kinase [Acidimicrobiales bacterium]